MLREQMKRILPSPLREMVEAISDNQINCLQELRVRIGQPFLGVFADGEYGIGFGGLGDFKRAYYIEEKDVVNMVRLISNFSLYAIEDELRQGYITVEGGHRIGLVGQGVVENGKLKTLKHISALNVRIARQVIGCSDKVLPYLLTREGLSHTLIISPPKCGKTTLLRDIIRNLSNGFKGYGPFTVGVVDERSEIAGCYHGIPQNDVGMRTDVLDACPKIEGMRMLLRSMAPDVIAVDEIGSLEDVVALKEVLGAGVAILATVHGLNVEDCKKRPALRQLLEQELFHKVVVLSNRRGPCTVELIDALIYPSETLLNL